MAIDVAFRLKTYLIELVTNNLLAEYQDQIEAWKLYIEDVVDAATTASDKVKDTLVNANAEQQAAREQAYAIGMLVLSMMAGPAISWLGAMVKIRWAPKITSIQRIETQTSVIWRMNALGSQYQNLISNPVSITVKNDVANQILGDLTKSAAGYLSGLSQSALKPSSQKAPELKTNFSALAWESFRTGLLRSLFEAQETAKSQIMELANTVRNDAAFGDKILARLFKQQPKLKSRPPIEQEQEGIAMIAKDLNDQRNQWANVDRWFYFANDPPRIKTDLNISYEREIWAQWILGQNIALGQKLVGGAKDYFDVRYEVKSDSSFFMTEAVQSELRQMALPNVWDLRSWDRNLNQALLGVEDVEGEQVDQGPGSTAKFDAQKKEGQEAVQRMLDWAKNYRPVGPLDYGAPRALPLPPIESYKGKFSSYKTV